MNRLGLGTQIGWGLGTIAPALVTQAFNVLMLRFLTDHVGIAAATAGLLIAGSKVYDAVTDPLTGVLTDHTRSDRGRRRPWLLWGGAALALSFVAMFTVPRFDDVGTSTFYVAATMLVFASAYSAYNIPYIAMPAEMTADFGERNTLMTFRVISVAIAGLLAQYVGLRIIAANGGGREGHEAMALMLAPVVLLSCVIVYVATRRAPSTARTAQRYPLSEQLKLIGRNRPFLILLIVKLLTLMTLGTQAAVPFFFGQILKVPDSVLATYFLVTQISVFAGQVLWLWLAKRIGKRACMMLALSLTFVVGLTWLAATSSDPAWMMYARAPLLGLGSGGVILFGQALLPDAMEYDFHLSGLRREGLFASFYTTVEKSAQAFGVTAIGAFLGVMGYVAGSGGIGAQPESALLAIRLAVGVGPALIAAGGITALMFYDLTEEKLTALRRGVPASP